MSLPVAPLLAPRGDDGDGLPTPDSIPTLLVNDDGDTCDKVL